MRKLGGKSTWIAAGVVFMLAVAIVPAVSNAANASSGLAAAASTSGACPSVTSSGGPLPDTQWSYGGQGWSNWSFTHGNTTVSHNASFGWTVIFTEVSNNTTGVIALEEQRTIGISVWTNVSKPNLTIAYFYHAVEVDVAFANLTNQSTVYVEDQAVPALGILNASVAACGVLEQSLAISNETATRMASLNVTGAAAASVSFSPSLGLIPLNLTGVNQWNSTSTASSAANWNISYAFTKFDGASGNGTKVGSLTGTQQVNLYGSRCWADHAFSDHKSRLGVNLNLQGPFNAYDGFILVPHSFDFFGSAPQAYAPYGFGFAGISSESLYVNPHGGSLAVTAADQSFASPQTSFAPQQPGTATTTVYGQPMSVSEAKTINQGLTAQPASPSSSPLHEVSSVASGTNLFAVVVLVAAVGVVAAIGAVAWVTYARRR